jgi:hypothetical protein
MELHGDEVQSTPLARALAAAGMDDARTRARFAIAVGVDAVTVWRWLAGRSTPRSHATREAVARELRWDVDDLFAEVPA